jgi:hypothetical protein
MASSIIVHCDLEEVLITGGSGGSGFGLLMDFNMSYSPSLVSSRSILLAVWLRYKAISLHFSRSYCLGKEDIRRSALMIWLTALLTLAGPPVEVEVWDIFSPIDIIRVLV